MALFVGVLSLLLVLVAAFAVDLGMQRVARRDMQSLADVVALDVARLIDGRSVSDLTPVMEAEMGRALSRNGGTLGETPDLDLELGALDAGGDFEAMAGGETPSAVRVTASTSVDFAFGVADSGAASRSAVATQEAGACFRLGSVAAELDASRSALLNSILSDALGSTVDLSLASYQGLADATVSLADLVAVPTLGVGGVNELLTTEVALAALYTATAAVLDRQGQTAQADVFEALALQVGPAADVDLGALLEVEQGSSAALGATFNALDLLYGSANIVDGQSVVEVPTIGLDLDLGLAELNGSVTVGQAARAGCGRVGKATASTQQVRTELDGTIASLPGVSAPLLSVESTSVQIEDLLVSAASATGALRDAQCGDPSPAKPDLISVLAEPGLVSIDGRLSIRLGAEIKLPLGLLGALVVVGLDIVIPAVLDTASSAPGQQVDMEFEDVDDYDEAYEAGSAGVGLGPSAITLDTAATTVTATLLDIPVPLGSSLASVINAVSGITGSLTTSLNTNLVLPLVKTLGVRLASADVFGIPRPLCNEPALRG